KMDGVKFQWAGIAHLNVKPTDGPVVLDGQPVIRLVATAQMADHLLVGRFSGLNEGQVYRVTAWIKPEGGSNIKFEAADRDRQPANYAEALFNLSTRMALRGTGPLESRGIDQDPKGWEKIWLDLKTSTGQITVAMRATNGTTIEFAGNGELGL